MRKIYIKIIKATALLVLLYFTLIAFIICCWHSETSLSVLAHLYELPASLFDRTGAQVNVVKHELNKETDDSWVEDIISQGDSLLKFDITKDIDFKDIVIARKNEEKDRFFAFYFNRLSCSSYVIRGCLYKNNWHIDKIYRTIHSNCDIEKGILDKTHSILSEMRYFKSRFSAENNPAFWTNNSRIFKNLEYESENINLEKQRLDYLNKFGNTCDFVVDFY